jgi:PA14 domain
VVLASLVAALLLPRVARCADDQPGPTFSTTVFGTTIPGEGLRGSVYELLYGMTYLPYFTYMKPVATLYTKTLNIPPQDAMQGFPGLPNLTEWFAIDYHGTIWISDAGPYHFQLTSDDGSKLYLDDVLVINNDGIHPPRPELGQIELKKGSHRIRVSYFESTRERFALVLCVARLNDPTWELFDTDDFQKPTGVKPAKRSKKSKAESTCEGGTNGTYPPGMFPPGIVPPGPLPPGTVPPFIIPPP